jgi:hypothetical protein
LSEATSTTDPATAHVKVLSDWHTKVVAPAIAAMKPGPSPNTAEEWLKRIGASLGAVLVQWQKVMAMKKPPVADMDSLRALAAKAVADIMAGYHASEGEQDAFRVEDEVKAKVDAALP